MEDDNKIENTDSSNGETVNESDVVIDVQNDADSDEVKELKEKNAKLFERAKKAEGFVKQSDGSWVKKAKPVENKPLPAKEASQDSSQKTYSREELNLRLDGYTDEEVDFIVRNGGKKELDNPNSIVSIAVKTRKEQREAEIAASKTASARSGSSDVEIKYTPEQMSKMSLKELEAILPKAN